MPQHFSMRTSMVLTIVAMGLIAMLLSVLTGKFYLYLALKNQQAAFEELVDLETQKVLDDTRKKVGRLGLALQKETLFRSAFQNKDRNALESKLNDNFHRYYVTTGQFSLNKLLVFDLKFQLVASSSEGDFTFQKTINPCPKLINIAHQRTGTEQLKPIFELCVNDGQSFLAALIPIGGLIVKGYMQVVIDPSLNLQQVEKAFVMPLELRYMNNKVAYQSKNWPKQNALKDVLLVNHILKNKEGLAILQLSLAYDVKLLSNNLKQSQNLILLATAAVTAIAALLALILLQLTVLSPMGRLTKHLEKIKKNKSHLADELIIGGRNLEVNNLATGFNTLGIELHSLYNKLEHMAYTDELTGLPNRTLFYDRLKHLTLINLNKERPFTVFMMDLDRFKLVNDTLGHNVGDQLLQVIGKRLSAIITRKSDIIARLGGDEFAAIFPQTKDTNSAIIMAQRIIQTIDQRILVEGHSLNIGISIGIVVCPYHGKNSNELIQRADVAMYHAKKNQQNYAWYEPSFDIHNIDTLTLNGDLKNAIKNEELELHYQPKIDMQNQRIKSVEALLRWTHPERGFISPERFISMAEQTGLIHPLTVWVLNKALQQVAQWSQQNISLCVAVNISVLSLRDSTLITTVKDALQKTGVAPEKLTLELTESAIMSNPEQALHTLMELDDMGVSLSVDDFGTGYSSLAYLKRLPVDEIKIDRSFVIDMDNDINDKVIVRSTIDLAHNMGLKVIAEGIETEQSWNNLAKMGCDLGQGYFMSRPLSAEALNTWLKNSSWGLNTSTAISIIKT